MKTEVIIVGAGPTGLMAANQLNRFGIDFIIVDSKDGPTIESRAVAVTARSLEIYHQLGVIQDVLDNGARINSATIFSDGKAKAFIPIGDIGKGLSDFHYLLGYEQSKNEKLLYDNIKKGGKDVLWNTEFIKLQEYSNGVTAEVKRGDKSEEIEGRYLIACDGASSPVRQQLNFNFSGGTYENKFIVADTLLNWDFDYDRFIISPGRKNFFAFLPLHGNRNYRVIGSLPRAFHHVEEISFRDIENVLRETVKFNISFERVNWFSVYKLHHRCIDQFNTKRVYLAGDSAHIHSPAGGQGMNTGLQDAYNLCWKLAMVLRGTANKRLLETYNEERLPFAKWLLNFTDKAFSIAISDKLYRHLFRKYILFNVAGILLRFDYFRKRVFITVSQIWYSYAGKTLSKSFSLQKLKFKAGDRLPYLADFDQGGNFYDLFTEASWHLLHIGGSPLTKEQQAKANGLFSFSVITVEAGLSDEWRKYGVNKELFLLVRPDNYISLICDSLEQIETSAFKTIVRDYFTVDPAPAVD